MLHQNFHPMKECAFCKTSLRGRPDRRYCSDACRNSHYYADKRSRHSPIVRLIKRRLLENYKALDLLLPRDEPVFKLPLNFLKHKLFCPSTCTGSNQGYGLLFNYAFKIEGQTCSIYRLQEQYVRAVHEGEIKLLSEAELYAMLEAAQVAVQV